ncbi:MAG TPA: glycoside hydrolase family 2 TIM barrel-domain containing protein, partial [Flavisolibacter sp.]|nr:glycoside hydrolase family 2 TIM barrel-domain containing protein [Flavisolibacter sp.]
MRFYWANHFYRLNLFAFVFFFHLVALAQAQPTSPRIVRNYNHGWQFAKGDTKTGNWQAVTLPHTWNVADVIDDEPGYYRGAGWYKKTIVVDEELRSKQLSLYFEGANQVTEVFVNGKKASHHIGGYTGFTVPITSLLKKGQNELLVKVDNSHNTNIPPLTADFTFYGGIYRDVFLVATNALHFDQGDGSNGVFITTPSVNKEVAKVAMKAVVFNSQNLRQSFVIITSIFDKAKKKIAELRSNATVEVGEKTVIEQSFPSVKNPRLWSPEEPYLYTLQTKIIDKKGAVLDVVTNPLGFRWFSFDAAKGFFLNGSPYKLIGASRHQDYKGLGNAVPDSLAVQDLVLLKNMGGNFLRVAHYPQDPAVMRACDSLGLLASVEIPIVNEITETDSFYRNCVNMQVEMIRQNFNHPSIIMWCYMNEVLLRPQFSNDKEQQKRYFDNIRKLAQQLEDLTRKEDPSRYTMMANHGNLEQYKKAGLLEIPMLVGWNLYSGWYGGTLQDFPRFLDRFHAAYPQTPLLVTEYGADADPRIRSMQPERFDKS